MTIYVEIAVNVPHVSGVFHYHLPPNLEGRVAPGHLVIVPFGRQTVQGVVMRLVDDPVVPETRAILDLLDPQAVLTAAQIQLAHTISEQTLAPLAACISLLLPPGLSQMSDTLYQLTKSGEVLSPERAAELTDAQQRLLDLLHDRGPLRGRQIERALPRRRWRSTARALERRGLVTSTPVLPEPTVRPKSVRTVQLACSPKNAESQMENLGRKGFSALERRQAILRFLMREPGPVNVSWVYAESDGNLSDLKKLADMGLVILGETEVWRDPLEGMDFIPTEPPTLTQEQEVVWSQVKDGIRATAAGTPVPPFLLYGVTGSGKTEIYLRAVEAVLHMGKQAIVLVPEIALTPQTVRRFISRFPGVVGLVHSGLSQGERYDTWRRARQGGLSLVVGPRSALFTPFPNLGLIVVDESHDDSYYQSETLPHYHARETAASYARLVGAVCLMGSATPDVVSTYRASRADWQLLNLPERILAHKKKVRAQMERLWAEARSTSNAQSSLVSHYRPLEKEAQTIDLPPVQVVDMREELKAGNRSIFSRDLHASLENVFASGEQAILFLNRRGTATFVFCRDCGYALKCPRCDIPLTYHFQRTNIQPVPRLVCHRCGYQRGLPKKCPQCGGAHIRHYGTGTQRVEREVRDQFPGSRTLRWDWETTRQKGSHDAILNRFANHRADVLIGTQMLAKGLDLPLVTLVGVVLADVGLNLPDYRASERAFQVLTQVAGRAGRSPLGGHVILQTYQPDHYAIKAASQHNYRDFYQKELGYRRHLGYPPFSRLVRLESRDVDAFQAEKNARELGSLLRTRVAEVNDRNTEIIGPAPCFFSRVGGFFRWQIVLRGPDPVSLLQDRTLDDWRVEVDPPSLL
jgi:primosomal protein N' (replication factor Y)